MTGKSKATDGALDEVVKRLHWIVDAKDDEDADLDSICTYAEQALAYLAALPTPTSEPVAWRRRGKFQWFYREHQPPKNDAAGWVPLFE